MSRVSFAILSRLLLGRALKVRMLWRRSASLINTTRTSSAIATSIFLSVSAWSLSSGSRSESGISFTSIRVSLVTPSTSLDTSPPKRSVSCLRVTPQSSTTSCKRAADNVVTSRFKSARKIAVPKGCSIYGPPDFLCWSLWQLAANSYTSRISKAFSLGRYSPTRIIKSSIFGAV